MCDALLYTSRLPGGREGGGGREEGREGGEGRDGVREGYEGREGRREGGGGREVGRGREWKGGGEGPPTLRNITSSNVER